MPEALYNLEESFRLSRLPVVRAAEILGAICFDDLVARRHEMASNELLIARLPEVHLNYLKFQQTLNDQGTDLQAYLSGVFHDLGCKPDTSAIILPDQYPANVQPAEHGLPAVHYNL